MALGLDLTQVGEVLSKRWPSCCCSTLRASASSDEMVEALPSRMVQLLNINLDKLVGNLEQGREVCLAVDDLL